MTSGFGASALMPKRDASWTERGILAANRSRAQVD